MNLFITLNDVLYFRDGRPFDVGEENIATLRFPPNPITFYGAIKGTIIGQQYKTFSDYKVAVNNGFSIPDEILPNVAASSLVISDFGLAFRSANKIKRFYPIPSDVSVDKSKKPDRYIILKPNGKFEWTNFPNNGNLQMLSTDEIITNKELHLDNPEGFITLKGLQNYLNNEKIDYKEIVDPIEVFTGEHKTTITKDPKSKTAQESKIAAQEFGRLKIKPGVDCINETGFVLSVSSKLLSTTGIKLIRLGGEGRTSHYEVVDFDFERPTLPVITGSRFKLILLTPAIFQNGWVPDGIDPTTCEGEIGEIKVSLIAAAVDRYTGIGGWDIIKNESKPLRRAVPTGSVYFFEAKDKKENLTEKLNNIFDKSLLSNSNFGKQGLGLSIIGGW